MTAPSNANTSGLEVVAWRRRDVFRKGAYFADRKDTAAMWAEQGLNPEPLVTAASAQARIAELEACAQEEADTLASKLTNAEIVAASWKDRATAAEARNAEVSMLAHRWMEAHDRLKAGLDYDLPTPADLPNEKARADRLAEIASKLSVAISWLDYPFIDNRTPEAELRQRVGFMMKDAEPHRAALQQEKQP